MTTRTRPPSNFTSDRHVLYAGWVIGTMLRAGIQFEPVRDDAGNYTNRVTVRPELGGDVPVTITLLIPPPPDDWDLFTPPAQPADVASELG